VNLENLRCLDLYSCHRISDVALGYLANSSLKIKELVLGNCPKVTDRGIQYLTKGCRFIERLDLFRTSVTKSAISSFFQFPNLVSLNLYNTDIKRADLQKSSWDFTNPAVEVFVEP